MQARITRWGNSLGLRIPKDIAGRIGLSEGSHVEIEMDGDHIIVRRTQPRYRLDDLLIGMTPDDMHPAFEWAPDVGREETDI